MVSKLSRAINLFRSNPPLPLKTDRHEKVGFLEINNYVSSNRL